MSCAVSDAPEPTPEVPAVYQPYVPEPNVSAGPLLNRLSVAAPFGWLRQGWQDLWRAPSVSLFFGVCFFVMGLAVLLVFKHAPLYTLALCAGFLLLGPFLCLGVYQVSRRLERGGIPTLDDAMGAWMPRIGQIAIFGAVLLVLEMLWGRASLVVFAVSFQGMPDFAGSIQKLLDPQNLNFIVAYLAVGSLFAGLIFAFSVIAMPMLLDRDTDAVTAGLASFKLCLTQPVVMFVWGVLITSLIVLAMLPYFLGLLIVGPWLGHATWHAYREALATDAAPEAVTTPAAL